MKKVEKEIKEIVMREETQEREREAAVVDQVVVRKIRKKVEKET